MTYSLYNKMLIPECSKDVRNTFPRTQFFHIQNCHHFGCFRFFSSATPASTRHNFLISRVTCLFQHFLSRENKHCLLEIQLKSIKALLSDRLIKNKNTYHGSLMNHLVRKYPEAAKTPVRSREHHNHSKNPLLDQPYCPKDNGWALMSCRL